MFKYNNFFDKKIKLKKTKYCFFIDSVFSTQITAGFTSSFFTGQLPSDFSQLLSYIGKQANFSYMDQRHSADLTIVEEPGVYSVDGLFSKDKNHFLVVKTADCLPLFLAKKDHYVGIIHMGWRSAKEGILKNIPFDLADFKVVAGPGLRSCCYQVGTEFRKFGRIASYLKISPKGTFFDPVEFAKDQLFSKGLKRENFFDLGLCSYCSKHNFFSHRRNKTTKRSLSFIGIK
ncbi:MAG: polyphenol oxidase family protein [Candidatus Omnitrophica bacterium]|nr:polyphenol oxidase family protein [Candidatus Omnitrophota bacterium]MCF7894418.1 polyphenol oxidase family protein [Candidatus Omnitrophota bacterium]